MSDQKAKNIVVVGGGIAGISTFNALAAAHPNHNLILINPNNYFVHNPGTIRMLVTAEGNLENATIMPFTPAFNQGNKKTILAKAKSITDTENARFVELDNGEKVDWDILVLATGSVWGGPNGLPNGEGKEKTDEYIKDWRKKFETAKDIVLVGGGAIGFEFAGEIKDSWPDKNVTLVHGQKLPLNDSYPDKYRKHVVNIFQARGVKFVFDDILEADEPTDGKVTTKGGKTITADLVVPTRGSRPATDYVSSLGAEALTTAGFVKVKPTLQLVGNPRIFALGDIIDWKEQKQTVKIFNHSPIVVKNVGTLLGSSTNDVKLKEYKGSFEMILLTNGKNGGTTYVDLLWGLVFGDWFTRMAKSKALFIDMTKKNLGL